MAQCSNKRKTDVLPVIWTITDDLWQLIEPVLLDTLRRASRDDREPLGGGFWTASFFDCERGARGTKLPKEFGDDSTVHRWFQRWNQSGVMPRIWAVMVARCEELDAVFWKWPSADGALCKARFGGGKQTGRSPTDCGKPGTKRSVLVDEQRGPLAVVIKGANVPDTKLLDATLAAIVVDRPDPREHEQHLCLDKGDDNPTGTAAIKKHQYVSNIRHIGEEAKAHKHKKSKPRRWVVERTLGWLSKYRALLVRYDQNWFNHLGLVQLACALVWYRRAHRLGAG